MKRRKLHLSEAERAELIRMRDTASKPYLRERAATILKIAEGRSPYRVAREGVLKARAPDTVYEWRDRYEAEGIAGLYIRPGRGRKPAFSPSAGGGSTGATVAYRTQATSTDGSSP